MSGSFQATVGCPNLGRATAYEKVCAASGEEMVNERPRSRIMQIEVAAHRTGQPGKGAGALITEFATFPHALNLLFREA